MKYKVSVIVPVYNAARYIGKCVDSLMRQTLKELEYIFVDDCSQDDSYEVLTKVLSDYPERAEDVKTVRHAVNLGVSQARNSALEIASGEFTAFCDSDDWVDERMYETLYDEAVSESAEIVMCGFFFAHHDRNVFHRSIIRTDGDKIGMMKSYLREEWNVSFPALISKALFDRSGYRFPVGIRFTEDFHLMVRLVYEARKIVRVDDALYYYNQTNASSVMTNLNLDTHKDEILTSLEIEKWMREKGIEEALRKEMGWRFLKAKKHFIYNNLFDEFRSVHPSSNRYIMSAPSTFCPWKMKMEMLLTLLHLEFICRWDNHRHGRCQSTALRASRRFCPFIRRSE